VPLAISPIGLMFQALKIPQLKKEAQTDDKTGLLNARHFSQAFAAEVERARRFGRPLALIMTDLDLLRNINNTYGHRPGQEAWVEISNRGTRGYVVADAVQLLPVK
jgi:diguanylate cyclase (GGDEF)-like protein